MALSKLDSTALGTLSGDIVFADGQGIDFSATSDGSGTMSSELLDDYETGSFTPTVAAGTVTTASGHYVKIGKMVRIGFRLLDFSDITSSTQLQITNLPFTPTGNAPNSAAGAVLSQYMNPAAAITYVDTNLRFFFNGVSGIYGVVKHSHLTNGSARIFGTAIYETT